MRREMKRSNKRKSSSSKKKKKKKKKKRRKRDEMGDEEEEMVDHNLDDSLISLSHNQLISNDEKEDHLATI